jgi:hypothetical protein
MDQFHKARNQEEKTLQQNQQQPEAVEETFQEQKQGEQKQHQLNQELTNLQEQKKKHQKHYKNKL